MVSDPLVISPKLEKYMNRVNNHTVRGTEQRIFSVITNNRSVITNNRAASEKIRFPMEWVTECSLSGQPVLLLRRGLNGYSKEPVDGFSETTEWILHDSFFLFPFLLLIFQLQYTNVNTNLKLPT